MRPSIPVGDPPSIDAEGLPTGGSSGFDDRPGPVETQLFNAKTVDEAVKILAESDPPPEE
jgi:hypothetical protein